MLARARGVPMVVGLADAPPRRGGARRRRQRRRRLRPGARDRGRLRGKHPATRPPTVNRRGDASRRPAAPRRRHAVAVHDQRRRSWPSSTALDPAHLRRHRPRANRVPVPRHGRPAGRGDPARGLCADRRLGGGPPRHHPHSRRRRRQADRRPHPRGGEPVPRPSRHSPLPRPAGGPSRPAPRARARRRHGAASRSCCRWSASRAELERGRGRSSTRSSPHSQAAGVACAAAAARHDGRGPRRGAVGRRASRPPSTRSAPTTSPSTPSPPPATAPRSPALLDAGDPAVLDLIARTVAAGARAWRRGLAVRRRGRPTRAPRQLMAAGLRSISVAPVALARVKATAVGRSA